MMTFMWTGVDDLRTFLITKTSSGVNGGEQVPRPGPDKRHVPAYERGHGRARKQKETTELIAETVDIDAVMDIQLSTRPKKKQKTAAASQVNASVHVVPVLSSPVTAHASSIADILARAVKNGKFDVAHLTIADLKLICRLNGISQSGNKTELVGKVNTYLSTASRTQRTSRAQVE